MKTPSHPHLAALLTDLDGVRATARRMRDELSDEQLAWRPDEGSWGVAECFEHLRMVDKAYCRRLDDAITRAAPKPGAPFRPSLVARGYFWGISPKTRLRMPTFKSIVPRAVTVETAPNIMDRFLEQQDELIALLNRADERDINTGRFSSPLARMVRLSVGEGLTVLILHEQRHAAQAVRVTEHPEFPG